MENYNKLKSKIKSKKFIIGVVGLGYVGLPISVSFTLKKFKVFGFDNDQNKIKLLKNNISNIYSINSKILKKINNKFFFPTSNFKNIKKCDAIIICVPTPINNNKRPIMKYIKDVITQIKKYLRKKQIIILECTTYPGTTEEYFLPIFKKKKYLVGKDVFLGYSPEREDPVLKKFSVLQGNLPKVVGGFTSNCTELISFLYKQIINKVYKAENIKSAEFSKLLENIYRSVNISLINELTSVAKKLKLNIYDIINAANTKPFGFTPFYPGPGVGGHCIPVDPFFLFWRAKKLGIKLKFIKHAGDINDQRPLSLCKEIIKYLNKHKFKKNNYNLVIYGLTYKKDSDDIRESPSLKIVEKLKKISDNIMICEPMLSDISKKNLKRYNFIIEEKNYYSFNNKVDVAIIVANHTKFNYNLIKQRFKIIFDCKNSFQQKFDNVIQI